MASELDFRHVSAADGDGAALVAAMIEEMRELYGGLDLTAPDMPTAGAAALALPGGIASQPGNRFAHRSNKSQSTSKHGPA